MCLLYVSSPCSQAGCELACKQEEYTLHLYSLRLLIFQVLILANIKVNIRSVVSHEIDM